MSSLLPLLKGVPQNGRQSVTPSGTVQSRMEKVADVSFNDAQMVASLFPESTCLPETHHQFVLNVSNTSKGSFMVLCIIFYYVLMQHDARNGTHSSTLAWKIPWTEEPGRLQSMGSLN